MTQTFIDKLALVEIRDKKVLVALSKGKDIWYVPGGKREPGESDQQALQREIKEELGVELDPDSVAYYHTFEAQAHGKPEGMLVRLTCYRGTLLNTPQPSAEIDQITYFAYAQREQGSDSTKLLMDDLKAKDLIE